MSYTDPYSSFGLIVIGTMSLWVDSFFFVDVVNVIFDKIIFRKLFYNCRIYSGVARSLCYSRIWAQYLGYGGKLYAFCTVDFLCQTLRSNVRDWLTVQNIL